MAQSIILQLQSPAFFRIWKYIVGHRKLWIRSEERILERDHYYGLVFWSVEHFNLPTEFAISSIKSSIYLFGSENILPIREREELGYYEYISGSEKVGSVVAGHLTLEPVAKSSHLAWKDTSENK